VMEVMAVGLKKTGWNIRAWFRSLLQTTCSMGKYQVSEHCGCSRIATA